MLTLFILSIACIPPLPADARHPADGTDTQPDDSGTPTGDTGDTGDIDTDTAGTDTGAGDTGDTSPVHADLMALTPTRGPCTFKESGDVDACDYTISTFDPVESLEMDLYFLMDANDDGVIDETDVDVGEIITEQHTTPEFSTPDGSGSYQVYTLHLTFVNSLRDPQPGTTVLTDINVAWDSATWYFVVGNAGQTDCRVYGDNSESQFPC